MKFWDDSWLFVKNEFFFTIVHEVLYTNFYYFSRFHELPEHKMLLANNLLNYHVSRFFTKINDHLSTRTTLPECCRSSKTFNDIVHFASRRLPMIHDRWRRQSVGVIKYTNLIRPTIRHHSAKFKIGSPTFRFLFFSCFFLLFYFKTKLIRRR